MRRLIEQGKQVAAYERYKKDKEDRDAKLNIQKTADGKLKKKQSNQNDYALKEARQQDALRREAEKSFYERQHKLQTESKIGPFSFTIEPFLEVEVLDRNQVFDDLIALEEILYNTSEPNQVTQSKGRRR